MDSIAATCGSLARPRLSRAWPRPQRALAAALSLVVLTSNSTSVSAVFVAYRHDWGLSPGDLGLAFAVYVGSLVPTLLAFGGAAERYGRRAVVAAGTAFMLAGTVGLLFAHGLPGLILARLLQGIGAALAVGVLSATFTEQYRGRIAAGQALAVVSAVALAFGPLLTALAFDLGAGPHASYLPIFALGLATFALLPSFENDGRGASAATVETPHDPATVRAGLRLAMPLVAVAWAGISLYLALVPAYLAAAVHAADPLIGALAFAATQAATVMASIRFGTVAPERSGPPAALAVVAGLALLVAGTQTNAWPLIALATLVVGAGGGVASGAAFAITARVGRGQRARVFARLLVAAYLGYSLPSLVTGIVAAHTTFTLGFVVSIAALGLIVAALPALRRQAAGGATVASV